MFHLGYRPCYIVVGSASEALRLVVSERRKVVELGDVGVYEKLSVCASEDAPSVCREV